MEDDFEDYADTHEENLSYDDDVLNFQKQLTQTELLPDIAKEQLWGCFDRSLALTNFGVVQIKEMRERMDMICNQILFFMPEELITEDVLLFLENAKILFIAVISRAYNGFERKQQNTKSSYVLTQKPEEENHGILGGIRKGF